MGLSPGTETGTGRIDAGTEIVTAGTPPPQTARTPETYFPGYARNDGLGKKPRAVQE